LTSCATGLDSDELDEPPIVGEVSDDEPLPASMTPGERIGKADGYDPRDQYPQYYGFTSSPAQRVTLPGEFEPVAILMMGWGSGASQLDDFFTEIIEAAADETLVVVYVPSQATSNYVEYTLATRGVNMDSVRVIVGPVDTIWMRDYGPEVVRSGTDHYVIDGRYYWGRWGDDYMPTAIAGQLSLSVSRPAIEIEGGNLLSNGAGTCVATDALVSRNAAMGYDSSDVRAILRDYYGCDHTVLVPAMYGEGTGHVDMSVHITDTDEVLVGQYDDSDSVNAQRLDAAAARLADAGFQVTRIPMPSNDGRSVFRSYTNGLAVNDSVLVPVYDEDLRYEATALAILEDAYPGREIIPIDSDEIIHWAGAVHCVTMTISP
jgi:agmatine/peptidylarginine deiminase